MKPPLPNDCIVCVNSSCQNYPAPLDLQSCEILIVDVCHLQCPTKTLTLQSGSKCKTYHKKEQQLLFNFNSRRSVLFDSSSKNVLAIMIMSELRNGGLQIHNIYCNFPQDYKSSGADNMK